MIPQNLHSCHNPGPGLPTSSCLSWDFRKNQVLLGLIPTKFDGHMARYDLNIHGEYDPEIILWHQYTNCLRQSDYIGMKNIDPPTPAAE